MKRVRDMMHRGAVTCAPDTTLGEAAALLRQHHIHALVVAESNQRPLGIVSDLDLLAGEWLSTDAASLEAMRRLRVGEMMNQPPLAIAADAAVSDAVALMTKNEVHRLIVTENDKAVGILSVGDLVLSLVRTSTARRTVSEVMSRGIVVCLEDTTVTQAARAMTERRSRSIVVVDPYGAPRGIVTGWDLLSAVPEGGDGADTRTVAALMHPPVTIRPGASLREAADKMISNHIHRLLVIDPASPDTFPLGLISTFDIVDEMAEAGSVWLK